MHILNFYRIILLFFLTINNSVILAKEKQDNLWDYIVDNYSLPINFHPRINNHIDWFLKNPDYLHRVTKRSSSYLHLVVQEVQKNNLPMELSVLPIIESAYYPFAFSHSSADGLWQFIPSTGKIYALRQNDWIDERRNIIKSSAKALEYLSYLYSLFDDWLLAIAAYNAGQGTVMKAILNNRKLGKPTDYWHLDLPVETLGYVPRFLAVVRLLKYPIKYNQIISFVDNNYFLQPVFIKQQIDLALIAKLASISITDVYLYNPAYNKWASAPKESFYLLLPKEKSASFKRKLSKYPDDKYTKSINYIVKKNDNLSKIANKYATDISYIKTINNLDDDTINAGDNLVIRIPMASKTYYTMSKEQRIKYNIYNYPLQARHIHTVEKGDSVFKIALNYGVEQKEIIKWNRKNHSNVLDVGEKLVIWRYKKNNTKKSKSKNIAKVVKKQENFLQYEVEKNDNLFLIANKFKVTVVQLLEWNNLDSMAIYPKQTLKLKIYQ